MNTEVENDFLDYLRRTMISGIGIPSSFLQESDQIDFARSLAMINGRFLRSIVTLQKEFGEHFTGIYIKLYKNEYGDDFTEGKDTENTGQTFVDYSKIEVKFPSPASLNMTNIADSIGTGRDIIDFITTTIVGQNADEKTKERVSKIITKNMIKNVDWDFFEKLVRENKMEEIEDEIEASVLKGGSEGEEGGAYS